MCSFLVLLCLIFLYNDQLARIARNRRLPTHIGLDVFLALHLLPTHAARKSIAFEIILFREQLYGHSWCISAIGVVVMFCIKSKCNNIAATLCMLWVQAKACQGEPRMVA